MSEQQNESESGESVASQETADTPQEHVVAQDESETQQRQAVYDYLDSGRQYGTTRNLRTPDGSAARAHFTYTPPSPARSHFRASHSRHQRGSYGGGVRLSSASLNGSGQSKTNTDTHMAMGDCGLTRGNVR